MTIQLERPVAESKPMPGRALRRTLARANTAKRPAGITEVAATGGIRNRSESTVVVYGRLNDVSADKHTEAWSSVYWDDPSNEIRRDDPRWQLPAFEPLGASDWYRDLPLEKRIRIAQMHTAATLTTGWMFENLLQRGLLDHSIRHHTDDVMFRYMQHEIAEESQHTMMFHELARRLGYRSSGMGGLMIAFTEHAVLPFNRFFPELFFLFVMGGEDPADHLQRLMIKQKKDIHPLMEQIMRIHVAEESRHLSFARTYLKDNVPNLGRTKKAALSVAAPMILGVMVRLMAHLHADVVASNEIPAEVLREAYGTPEARQLLADCAAKPRALCQKLGLIDRRTIRLWKRYGIWDERAAT